jgi:hypothetical protein
VGKQDVRQSRYRRPIVTIRRDDVTSLGKKRRIVGFAQRDQQRIGVNAQNPADGIRLGGRQVCPTHQNDRPAVAAPNRGYQYIDLTGIGCERGNHFL